MAIFSSFFFRQYRQGNYLLLYSRDKKRLYRLQKQQVENSRKIDIFPKGLTHGCGPKLAIFSTFCFLGNIAGQENVFNDILETKNAFIGYKNNNLKTVEKLTFFQRG